MRFGRTWAGCRSFGFTAYHAVKVTGALFHTQGGLAIDSMLASSARWRRQFANLFAAGGAAVGVSGPEAAGYLSGNGLLTAVGLGYVAGRSAALISSKPPV